MAGRPGLALALLRVGLGIGVDGRRGGACRATSQRPAGRTRLGSYAKAGPGASRVDPGRLGDSWAGVGYPLARAGSSMAEQLTLNQLVGSSSLPRLTTLVSTNTASGSSPEAVRFHSAQDFGRWTSRREIGRASCRERV